MLKFGFKAKMSIPKLYFAKKLNINIFGIAAVVFSDHLNVYYF